MDTVIHIKANTKEGRITALKRILTVLEEEATPICGSVLHERFSCRYTYSVFEKLPSALAYITDEIERPHPLEFTHMEWKGRLMLS